MSKEEESKKTHLNVKLDVPGVKELSEATKEISTSVSSGLSEFLGSICSPVANQLGGFLEDQVKYWRYHNLLRFTGKTKSLHQKLGVDPSKQVHPRIMLEIVNGVFKQEDDELLNWWAGLTVAACEECPTDEDLIFTEKMDKITCLQKKVIEYICCNAEILHTSRGLFVAKDMTFSDEEIFLIADETNVDILDRELDSLRSHGLIEGGFNVHKNDLQAIISPTSLGLQFYARCTGQKDNLIEYFNSKEITHCPRCGRIHK